MNCDVVVVGCGVAGLSSALTARTGGALVELLERSPREIRGGNSRYTEAYFRMKNETQVSDDFEDKLALNSHGAFEPSFIKEIIRSYDQWPPLMKSYPFLDPELISMFANSVPETVSWLKTLGVKFLVASPFLTQSTTRIAPSGGGEGLVETLGEAAEKAGVRFNYETTAKNLVQDEKGIVCGVDVWSKEAGMVRINAKAVVLACGGFQGNLEMMTRYVGKKSHLTRPVAPGGLYNKGEGIEMALDIGAAAAGQYDAFHAEPIDPRSTRPEAVVYVFGYGILVNRKGQRFIDEASGMSDDIYEEVARKILMQEGGIAYLIYDSKMKSIPNIEKGLHTDREPIKANSIAELASKLEIDPVALEATILNYNAAVQPGKFDPFKLDGKRTKGISPEKSNWAMTIDENDLLAIPLICSNCFTFGGLKVTPKAEVLNRDGYVIPGLYAAGEVIGFYYGTYVGATSVLRGLVFGRKAGETSAQYVSNSYKIPN
jgi:tricarballylate dehydrogenase